METGRWMGKGPYSSLLTFHFSLFHLLGARQGSYLFLSLFFFPFPFPFPVSAPLATCPGVSATNNWFASLTLAKRTTTTLVRGLCYPLRTVPYDATTVVHVIGEPSFEAVSPDRSRSLLFFLHSSCYFETILITDPHQNEAHRKSSFPKLCKK